MLVAILALASLLPPPDGLRAGESIVRLADMPEAPFGEYSRIGFASGRILDAFTGRPVPGAVIEVWDEEISRSFGGFYRIGTSTSAADGSYVVRMWEGMQFGEKIRVMAPGYLTLSGVAGEARGRVRLFPRSERVPRLLVTDLLGRPLAGARITSTYSCSHDLPAFDVRTDALGTARLPQYGLQADVQELRVQAPGHELIEYLDGDPALERPSGQAPLEVRLGRMPETRFRLLGRSGEPLRHTPLYVIDDDCYHVVRTDKYGVAHIACRNGLGELYLQTLDPDGNEFVGLLTPSERVPSLRLRSEDWPEDVPQGQVRIDWQGHDVEGTVPAQLFHEDGWTRTVSGGRTESVPFPAGTGYLLVGSPFHGYRQTLLDFVLEQGQELTLRPELDPEPKVRILRPEDPDARLTLQVGTSSRRNVPFDEWVPVPAHAPLVLMLESRGRYFAKRHTQVGSPLTLDAAKEFDMSGAAEQDPAPECVQLVRFAPQGVDTTLGGELALSSPHAELAAPQRQPDGRWALRGPEGSAWLARFEAEGHVPIWVRGVFSRDAAPLERTVPAWASVELVAPFEFEIEEEDLDLEQLAPGPLQLIVRGSGGRRYGVTLQLESGERRRIRIQ